MKKYFAALVLVLALSGAAFAEVKIDLDQHDCLICKETFFCFKGDPLDRIPVEDQPKKVYMLSDRSKHMKDCKNNFKMHRFVKIGTRNVGMDFIRSNMNKIVVIDGGGTLNQKLYGWQCMLCGKKFYSFYGINLKKMSQSLRIIKGSAKIRKALNIPDGVAVLLLECDFYNE
ncbi:MAG: hypothetical protein IJP54_00775, partial [Synergistaceae bacterium]|nr:hypothetical protein [Synergistaceae bacterium]